MLHTRTSRLVTGLAVVILLMLPLLSGCARSTVPDVVGKSQADAVRTLEAAGFTLGEIRSVYSSEVPRNVVAATDPAAGQKAKGGSKVSLSVNSGIGAKVQVPAVTGVSQDVAESTLLNVDLIPFAAASHSSTAPAGSVITQVPSAGTTSVQGDTVVIQVSSGPAPETVAVPNVVGKSKSSAQSAIEGAGLKIAFYGVYSNKVAKNNVVAQSPKGGANVTAGAEIAVAYSLGKGVGSVTVPNVVGKSEADAVAAMNSAGLKPKTYDQYSDTVAKGKVSGQLPAGGSTTGSGSQVAIVVSLGKAPVSSNVTVPGVGGQSQADATKALEAAGFAVTAVPQPSTAPSGTVTAQLPVAGSAAPVGTPVVILVSAGQ